MASWRAAFTLLWFPAATMAAAETAPDAVAIVEGAVPSALTDVPGDPANGRKVYAARSLGNCLACHATSDQASEQFHGDVGPPMDGVADRYDVAQLRAIIVNAKAVFGEDTIMPGFYTLEYGANPAERFVGKTILSAQDVEDVVAYLETLKE
ncbi:MAG: sulfur oxidation c-type cytochrome SoxX [Rubrimonas sp.]